MKKNKFTFIDLFAGIGGFHTAMHSVGGKCVFASEWDKYARISYEANYKDIEPDLFQKDSYGNYLFFNNDITEAIPESIPAFDVCCGGFPCQPFSSRSTVFVCSHLKLHRHGDDAAVPCVDGYLHDGSHFTCHQLLLHFHR